MQSELKLVTMRPEVGRNIRQILVGIAVSIFQRKVKIVFGLNNIVILIPSICISRTSEVHTMRIASNSNSLESFNGYNMLRLDQWKGCQWKQQPEMRTFKISC
jgi:hypothetical protein